MERPLFLPLFALVAGSSLAGIFTLFVPTTVVFPLLILSFLAIFVRSRDPFLVALACLMFCWGNLSLRPFLLPEFPAGHVVHAVGEEPVVIEGILDSRPESGERGGKLVLAVESVCQDDVPVQATGKLLLYSGAGRFAFRTGDRIRFAARIRRPRNYGLPGEFDRERSLALRGIYATAFVRKSDEAILIRAGVAHPFQHALDGIAAEQGAFIESNVAPVEGGILQALLLGERGHVPRQLEDAYSKSGVNHILSISGFHVGIIALFMYWLILSAGRASEFVMLQVNLRRTALLFTLPLLVGYLFLTGAAPATARSVIMIGAYIVTLALQRESDPINALLLAAFTILGISPPALFDLSFQLSFLAIWGIVLASPLWDGRLQGKPGGKLVLFFLVSLAATAATLLPVAYYFHRTTLTGLIANFLIVPLMGYGAVLLGFSALPFVYLAPLAARLFLAGAAWLVKLSDAIILFLARIPTLPPFNPDKVDLLLFYLLLTALTFIRGRTAKLACSGSLAVLLAGHGLLHLQSAPRGLTVTFFSIGQGDSALVSFPDGRRMLIDGGGSAREGGMDVGERLLAPALRAMGVDRLDYLVLTHPHPDHLQGLTFIAANFPVGEFIEGPAAGDSTDYRELQQALAERGVPVRRMSAATPPFAIGGVRLEPLAPLAGSRPGGAAEADVNDASLVFRLVSGREAVLFTGDISRDVEARLLERPERLACTVLKVPHHGSRYSSSPAFLRAAAPQIAVISAGYRNSFRLPAPETLASLRQLGIRAYRTDLDGTVQAAADEAGEGLTIRTIGHFR
jgi:competence protein ComEC